MTRTLYSILLLGTLGTFGCTEQPTHVDLNTNHDKDGDEPIGDTPEKPGNRPEDSVGGEDTTVDHMPSLGADEARDPYEIAKQREEEGTPEARARLHSCQKLGITTLRNILTDFGVNLDATGNPPTAGQLINNGGTALGQANYAARMGEDIVWTAAGAAKMFDIFVQAAPEIIAAMPNLEQCKVDGVAPSMFNADDSCNADAITCLIGRPATPDHIALCNSLVHSASSIDNGKNIAVGALLSAAHSCE
ncbi:MAG: hypothetical protein U0271_46165 [Polyangiaceae bacterium]